MGQALVFPTLFFPPLLLQLLLRSPEQVDGISLLTSSEVLQLSILQREKPRSHRTSGRHDNPVLLSAGDLSLQTPTTSASQPPPPPPGHLEGPSQSSALPMASVLPETDSAFPRGLFASPPTFPNPWVPTMSRESLSPPSWPLLSQDPPCLAQGKGGMGQGDPSFRR